MGAYDNPRLFNAPDVTAGSKAFINTFTKGFEEGFDKFGTQKIAERKEYEKGIFEKGEELKKQLDVAVENGSQTRAQVQDALKSFYDEALAVDPVTKKGIGGLFATPKEKRLGDIDLQEAQSNFTDAITPINTMFNYSFSGENDILETEDRGHEFYKEKRILYEAIRDGKAKTNFGYTDGKFNSSVTVEIDGKMETFTPDKIQAIFTASGPEQRAAIDKRHDEFTDGVYSEMEANVANAIERAKIDGKKTYKDGENEARRIIRRRLGIADPDPNKLPSKKSLAFINDEYNNHADIDANRRLEILREQPELQSLTDAQLELIAEEPLMIGEKFFEKFGDNAAELFEASIKGKTRIVEEAALQDIRDQGILDKGYAPPVENNLKSGGGSGASAANKAFGDQQLSRVINLQQTILSKENPLIQGGGVDVSDRDINTPIPLDRPGGELEGIKTLNIENKSKYITNAFVNPATKRITIGYIANRKVVEGREEGEEAIRIGEKNIEKTLEFDLLDPRSMNEFFDMIGGTTAEQDSATEKYYNTFFGQNAWKVYDQNLDLLNKPGMEKWQAEVVKKKGLENAKQDPRYKELPWFQNLIRESQKIK